MVVNLEADVSLDVAPGPPTQPREVLAAGLLGGAAFQIVDSEEAAQLVVEAQGQRHMLQREGFEDLFTRTGCRVDTQQGDRFVTMRRELGVGDGLVEVADDAYAPLEPPASGSRIFVRLR